MEGVRRQLKWFGCVTRMEEDMIIELKYGENEKKKWDVVFKVSVVICCVF